MGTIRELYEQLKIHAPTLELREHEPMSRYTTFRVGGPVCVMALPKDVAQAQTVVRLAAQLGISPFFLGNGSNLLVADGGYDGLVVKLTGALEQVREQDGQLVAGGGILLSRLAKVACEQGLTGLEFAHGIPGSLGGGATMNAGAYGGELAQVITAVTCLTPTGELQVVPAAECDFSYRHSAFSDGKRLILEATLALEPGEKSAIQARMEELARQRREKQPLEWPSAGSTFKRPEGHFAAALIDQCGLKGLTVGGAQVSEKHAGFIVNKGGATCADILALMAQVRQRVLDATGVMLEPEVKTMGVN